MAKKDSNGALITDKNMLEKLYLDTYIERLKPNKMAPELENLEMRKEYLFKLRYEICKTKKTKEWTRDDLEKVLKSMKNNKKDVINSELYQNAMSYFHKANYGYLK